MKEELIFLEGVSDGATKFYKSITKQLKDQDTVIGNDQIGRAALDEINKLTIASVKFLGALAISFADTEDQMNATCYSKGVLVGTELFGEAMKQLLDHHGHVCAEALHVTWPTTQAQIIKHVLDVMNESETIH